MKDIVFLISIIMTLILASMIVSAAGLERFDLAAENKYLKLYINKNTTEIAVLDKDSNSVFYSSPQDLENREKQRSGKAQAMMKAPLKISYFSPAGDHKYLDVYNDSVLYDQYSISKIKQGVRIEYELKKKWEDEDYLPLMIDKERFEKLILSKIEDDFDRELFLKDYALISLEKHEKYPYSFEEFGGVNIKKLFGNYKLVSMSSATDLLFYGK